MPYQLHQSLYRGTTRHCLHITRPETRTHQRRTNASARGELHPPPPWNIEAGVQRVGERLHRLVSTRRDRFRPARVRAYTYDRPLLLQRIQQLPDDQLVRARVPDDQKSTRVIRAQVPEASRDRVRKPTALVWKDPRLIRRRHIAVRFRQLDVGIRGQRHTEEALVCAFERAVPIEGQDVLA